ncbi:MAG: DUF488 domain-containing protein [Actinomycetota bacterium]|nr:DUF488 domain-containing protein [Actinomycetota bacterium]
MEIYTIGFTKKTAPEFFGALRRTGIRRLLDVRLNNSSQLAGLTKRDDLPFFLEELCGARYAHEPLLAPTPQILDAYRKGEEGWPEYERRFLELMRERRVEEKLDRDLFRVAPTALLCSEVRPERCHRRLVLEYLGPKWGGIRPVHL